MDTLNAMKLYCHIVEAGQLSIAANQLNLSKGAVSKQLSKLETHLGGRLLNRTTRRLTPTEAGLAYYEQAKAILESVEEAECAVTGLTTEPRGTLKINAPMSFGSRYLGDLLAKYNQKYPQVKIDITLHDRQIDLIEEGYDLALRIADLKDSTLIARRLAPCNIVICASPEYLKQHGEPQSPDELKHHECLSYSYVDNGKRWTLESPNPMNETKHILIHGSLRANNGNLLCDALVNGMGIAILPTFIAGDAIRQGKAKVILPEWKPKSPHISLLYPSVKFLSAKVRAFIDLAAEHFEGQPEWDKGLFR